MARLTRIYVDLSVQSAPTERRERAWVPPPRSGERSGAPGVPDLGSARAGDLRMAPPAPDLALVDDATLVGATLPERLMPGEPFAARVTMHNSGTSTWTRAGGYKLGAVGDSDPFY